MICTAELTVKALRVVVETVTLLLILCVWRKRKKVKQRWKKKIVQPKDYIFSREQVTPPQRENPVGSMEAIWPQGWKEPSVMTASWQSCNMTICCGSVNDDVLGRNHPGHTNNVARVKTYKEEQKIKNISKNIFKNVKKKENGGRRVTAEKIQKLKLNSLLTHKTHWGSYFVTF